MNACPIENPQGRARLPQAASYADHGFTLIELLVIVAMLAILTVLVLPGASNSKARGWQVQCAGNLRQVGVGLNLYSNDSDGYLPIGGWPSGQNPWQSYSVARVVPGTSILTRGFMNLGLLFRTKTIADVRSFYCPATSSLRPNFSYPYTSAVSNTWPSTAASSGDEQIRVDYNFYPQLRTLEVVGGTVLPKLVFSSVPLEFGSGFVNFSLIRYKLVDLDMQKSVACDLVNDLPTGHKTEAFVSGVNALFPDGHAAFQSERLNPQPFQVWRTYETSQSSIIGNDTTPSRDWRTVVSLWKP